jgi:uroporphyrinogen-III decarboxylase
MQKEKRIDGGYIFAPGCELPPGAPLENVMAVTRAVNEFGRYY